MEIAVRRLALVFVLAMSSLECVAQPRNIKLPDPPAGSSLTPRVLINRKDSKNWIANLGGRVYVTKDAGKTWNPSKFKQALHNYGDHSLASNGRGGFMVIATGGPGKNAVDSLRDRIATRATPDGGITWEDENFYNLLPMHPQQRPQAGMENGTIYMTWTVLDRYPTDTVCSSNIFFAMTSSEGKKWSDPIQVNTISGDCSAGKPPIQSAAPVHSSDGKVFILWENAGSVFLDRSYNGGKTWLSNDMQVNKSRELKATTIPGVAPTLSMPSLGIDKSMSFFRSSLYLLFSDQSSGENDSDVWLARSTNRGDFWTQPQRVNQDSSHRHQFFPTMAVDEETGVIFIAWYDRRDHEDGATEVYLAYSVDGGAKFTEMKISESSFMPPITGPVSLDVFNGVVVPVWTRIDNGTASVWAAPLKVADFIKKDDMPRIQVVKRK